VRHQFVGVLGFNVYFPGEKYILRWRNTYSYFPDKFWGFGNNTPDQAEENYVFSQIFINPQLIRKIYKDFYVGFSYEMQKVYDLKYQQGGIFDIENVAGKDGGIVSGAGFVIAWDSRDNAFYCTKGSYAQLMVLDFNKNFGSDFTYQNYVIDLRKFLMVRKKDVFAMQAFGYLNSGNVAIRNMAILGGSDIMRGYYEGRYTDKNLVAFQAEYRMPLRYGFGLAAFGGYGEVFRYAKEFRINELKYSYGAGIRYALNRGEKLNLRIDYGFGENSSGWYFTVRESF
jgi:outer membrane protein assembly factor BamA